VCVCVCVCVCVLSDEFRDCELLTDRQGRQRAPGDRQTAVPST